MGDYTLILLNANGPGRAMARKKEIVDRLKSEKPQLVFMQEFTWKALNWKNLDIPGEYHFEGNRDAGIVFDTKEVTFELITSGARRLYDQMRDKSDKVADFFDLARLSLFKVKSKGVPNFEALCASWHGEHTRATVQKKKIALGTLIEFLLKIKVDSKLPLVLGGDFNLRATDVKSVVSKWSKVLSVYTPSDASIDMFVTSSDFHKDFEKQDVTVLETNEVFDHKHIRLRLVPVIAGSETDPDSEVEDLGEEAMARMGIN